MNPDLERNLGEQPLARIMREHGLQARDLVAFMEWMRPGTVKLMEEEREEDAMARSWDAFFSGGQGVNT